MDEVIDFIYRDGVPAFDVAGGKKLPLFVIGPNSSGPTQSAAQLLTAWRVPNVSYAATSAALTSSTDYPYFYRTVPPDSKAAGAMAGFLRAMKWHTVSSLYTALIQLFVSLFLPNLRLRPNCVRVPYLFPVLLGPFLVSSRFSSRLCMILPTTPAVGLRVSRPRCRKYMIA